MIYQSFTFSLDNFHEPLLAFMFLDAFPHWDVTHAKSLFVYIINRTECERLNSKNFVIFQLSNFHRERFLFCKNWFSLFSSIFFLQEFPKQHFPNQNSVHKLSSNQNAHSCRRINVSATCI